MKKKKNIIIMFLLSIIVINVSDYIIRKIQKQNMYKTEIKGVVWKIIFKTLSTLSITDLFNIVSFLEL